MIENEKWFEEMIESGKLPTMMVPPRMGLEPKRVGEVIKWVKTFWQRTRETYCKE